MNWWIVGCIVVGLIVVGITRPWRFFWRRRYCPQCDEMLARWDWWGWKENWTCPRCGCQIGQ